ncbi:MAG: type IX secretion system protein PorQ [Bacteroidales bacterium]
MRKLITYTLCLLLSGPAFFPSAGDQLNAQSGGDNTWEFLNLTSSARVASLGGKNITLRDGDLNLVFNNPALLDSTMNNQLVLNYVNYFTDINYGYVSWAVHNSRMGNFAAGIHYIDYGKFTAASQSGLITGEFSASENSVNLSWSMPADSLISIGATLKGINSSFEQYSSFGIAIDAGINYYNPAKLLSVSLVMKNLGAQLTTWYREGKREPLPFELQLGMTKQLEHAPLRFSVLYQHLQDFGLNEKSVPENEAGTQRSSFPRIIENLSNELVRHFIIGIEFMPVRNFSLHAGYNNLRRHQLKMDARPSTTGFSWGFGVNINRFRIGFGQARYHLAGSSAHFSISTNLSAFYGN